MNVSQPTQTGAQAETTAARGGGRPFATAVNRQQSGCTCASPKWRDCGGGRLEVVGERELAFFPGVARGSAFPGFQYETEAGAVAAGLRFRAPHTCPAPACEALPGRADSAGQPSGDAGAGGSPLRLPPAAAHVREAVTPPVAQSCTSEAGALPHAARTREPGSEPLARHAGAGAPAAAPARRGAACAAEEACDDGWVLVSREDALPGPRAALECAGGRVEGASEGPAAQRARDAAPGAWERCVDYCNGGPMFCAERGARGQDSGFSPGFAVLAEYAELGGAPAAVRCRVGAGRAVLVGTHPELAPHWLDAACAPGGPTGEGRGGGAAPVLQARAAGVREALAAGAASRRRLWRMLLSEAGMHGLRI
jgi:biotin--protein ligase